MGFEPAGHFGDPTEPVGTLDRSAAEEFADKMSKIDEILHEQMTLAQASQEEFANRHRQPGPKYKEGDEVWLDGRNLPVTEGRTKKLSNKFEGPFTITKVIGSHAYQLDLPVDWAQHDVFHTALLRPKSMTSRAAASSEVNLCTRSNGPIGQGPGIASPSSTFARLQTPWNASTPNIRMHPAGTCGTNSKPTRTTLGLPPMTSTTLIVSTLRNSPRRSSSTEGGGYCHGSDPALRDPALSKNQ